MVGSAIVGFCFVFYFMSHLLPFSFPLQWCASKLIPSLFSFLCSSDFFPLILWCNFFCRLSIKINCLLTCTSSKCFKSIHCNFSSVVEAFVCVCVTQGERNRERKSVCVWHKEREIEREKVCVCVWHRERERERKKKKVCVCVCDTGRERERKKKCVYLCVCVCVTHGER